MARPFRSEGLVLGILLVALGSAWMASNLGQLDLLSTLRTWWPASLVVWGAVEIVAFAMNRTQASNPARETTGTLSREDS